MHLETPPGLAECFHEQGVVFLDIFPLLRDPVGFETLITNFVHRLTSHTIAQSPTKKVDVVVGLDARGFLLGPIIAMRLGAAFVPVRKKGKLPGETVHAEYEKEYGVVRTFRPWISTKGGGLMGVCVSGVGRLRDAVGRYQARPERRDH